LWRVTTGGAPVASHEWLGVGLDNQPNWDNFATKFHVSLNTTDPPAC
jgi:hypothetical protein